MQQIRTIQLASGQRLSLHHGDLTQANVDAIVNAANTRLRHGGGVAGAIVRRGGHSIQHESNQIAPIPTGQAGITGAGKLPARHVIHAVGPRGSDANAPTLLHQAVSSALQVAHQHQLTSIALPAISTGIFGFPKVQGAQIITQALVDFCTAHPDSTLQDLRIVLIDQPSVDIFRTEFDSRWPLPAS